MAKLPKEGSEARHSPLGIRKNERCRNGAGRSSIDARRSSISALGSLSSALRSSISALGNLSSALRSSISALGSLSSALRGSIAALGSLSSALRSSIAALRSSIFQTPITFAPARGRECTHLRRGVQGFVRRMPGLFASLWPFGNLAIWQFRHSPLPTPHCPTKRPRAVLARGLLHVQTCRSDQFIFGASAMGAGVGLPIRIDSGLPKPSGQRYLPLSLSDLASSTGMRWALAYAS